jgi:hypothetical protein
MAECTSALCNPLFEVLIDPLLDTMSAQRIPISIRGIGRDLT